MFRQQWGIYVAIGARPPGSWVVGSASLRRFGVPLPRCGSSCVVALCWRALNFTAIRPFPVGGLGIPVVFELPAYLRCVWVDGLAGPIALWD